LLILSSWLWQNLSTDAVALTNSIACLLLKVRPVLPSPAAGQLPLPRSLPTSLQSQLCAPLPSWQQLPWPQGQAPQQPAPTSKAALAFKVRS
jgi:hypothetical protein